ncbi:DAHP synthetase [Syncephalis pseudoplumigaleata]|uniref:Phospho-2-dehydro-3-deoxyheptonate aldolase n=1 Tax=Syncephalis pseudoplumigaleata TaxID=1712513 RepID=A0A4P9Z752_9FUNG|nr:DAHP synthetase [Syncephalis pseudoplumigaleata]|eukprot:RKP27711.1 DAHP synthetase [Syncephalis pseudoplumigaleata]
MSTSPTDSSWTPDAWTQCPIKQDVHYEDQAALQQSLEKLRRLPPLVSIGEVRRLREQLRDVALGKAFLLQGGDCAELFDYCSQDPIENKLKVLLQMSLVLIWGARLPVVRIARMAGQYAKPRSSPTEMYEGQEIPSFRGDNVNGFAPDDRQPDPTRLVSAYFHSAATMNYVRAILNDLHHPSAWDLQHVRSSAIREEYQSIVNRIVDAMDFMRTIGADPGNATATTRTNTALNTVDMFVSHEALLLEYEQSLTRRVPTTGNSGGNGGDSASSKRGWYNAGAHFVWIGDRTRQVDGAHVNYCSGIENPIGIKIGPTTKADELVALLDKVDPHKEAGKVTLITRYGVNKIEQYLPDHIKAVRSSGHIVVWSCDPMHGNTEQSATGVKTRDFTNIIGELSRAIRIHDACGSRLNGVHLELTGDSVTECIGGSQQLDHQDLATNYQTFCDPRLNYEQSMDVAFLVAKHYEQERRGVPGL